MHGGRSCRAACGWGKRSAPRDAPKPYTLIHYPVAEGLAWPQAMLRSMGLAPKECAPQRAIYCSRTLNLRSIQARVARGAGGRPV